MSKVSKTLQSVILGGLIFIAAPQKAEAIGWFPPMPWDFEVDIPGDAGKVVSLLKSTYRKVQMVQSQLNTINLDAIKSGNAAALFKDLKGNYKMFAKGPKAPGKGKMKGVSALNIQEGDLDEAHYYDAFSKLFLEYPLTESIRLSDGKRPTYQVVHTAYKHKSNEFKQDMIVDTYLAGRITEDYLVLVERTLKRLDLCQKKADGYEPGSEKCVFFGLPFVKVEAENTSEAPDENSDGNGQLGEAMNNYVVTIVYDRLMRIVEDLTATEAIYRSARQLDLITPIMPQSSADMYLPQKYQFAYNNVHEASYADMIINNFSPSSCGTSGSANCPDANKDLGELEGVEKTELLGKLQPLEDTLNKAVILHNLKVQLPEFKDQFRRYRKTEEIHKRALMALEASDKCSQEFIKTYRDEDIPENQVAALWGTAGAVNEHGARTGISKDLILKYQEASDTTIIGSNDKCTGYYETCPEGYTLDKNKPCEILDEQGNVAQTFPLYACVLDIGSADTEDKESSGDGPNYPAVSLQSAANPNQNMSTDEYNDDYEDEDLLGDSTKADIIDKDNRIKAESTWQIGREKLMDLTEAGTLKFTPWNDQMELQKEYLRQKYRNIELIIKSMDQGVESLRISSTAIGNSDEEDDDEEMQKALNTLAGCTSFTEALEEVRAECAVDLEGEPDECTPSQETGMIVCTRTVEVATSEASEESTSEDDEEDTSEDDEEDTSEDDEENTSEDDEENTSEDDEENTTEDDEENTSDDEGTTEATTEPVTYTCERDVRVLQGCAYGSGSGTAEIKKGRSAHCGTSVALNVKDISMHYFSDILGRNGNQCSPEPKEQAKNLKDKTKEKGRLVAQDVLAATVQVRINEDKKVRKFVEEYNNRLKAKKDTLANKKASLGTYNQKINMYTEKKNSAQQEWKNTLDRIDEIDKEVKQIEARKPYAKIKKPTENNSVEEVPDNRAKCAMDIQQLKLNFEKAAISGKSQEEAGADWEIPAECDEDVQEDLEKSLGEDFFKTPQIADYVISMEQRLADNNAVMDEITEEEQAEITANNKKHVVPEDAEKMIKDAKEIIDENTARRKVINQEIQDLIAEIDRDAEDFAKAYLEAANAAQVAVENANKEYEKFLDIIDNPDEDGKRMLDIAGHKAYNYDNLQTTMVNFLGYDEALEPTIKNEMMNEFDGFDILGITGDHFIDGAIANALHIPAGYYESAVDIVNAIKENIINEAAQKTAKTIMDTDNNINEAMKAALEKVKDFETNVLKLDSDGNMSEAGLIIISDHDNYGSGKTITEAHNGLIQGLKGIQAELVGQGATDSVFGIPDDVNSEGDTKYYVTLPARGVNYPDREACQLDANGRVESGDCGAGQDYNAPKRPLLNLPPLREVFYYSSLDYRDTPKEGGDSPAITHLVNLKYPKDALHKWEYLPETWLYVLARPNLRDDGKYQQTFEERHFDNGHLQALINKNDATNEGFRRLIARAGVYPCKLKDGSIIDIDSNDGGSMRFLYRRSAPEHWELQECQEVALNNVAGTSCYTYNKGEGGICHLLADHGKDGVEDSQTPSINIFSGDNPLYENYSELGQVMAWRPEIFLGFHDLIPGRLTYRPLQRSLHEYLLSEDDDSNQKNSMERQNIQTATFTRNIFSSFLETVNVEHAAKRSLETAKENIKNSVKNLCTQIENARPKSSREVAECNAQCQGKIGEALVDCTAACQQEKIDDCINVIMEGDGLAKTAEDADYGVRNEYGNEKYEGINCDRANSGDAYASYFCQLSDWQDELIDKVKNGYTDDFETDANGKPLRVASFAEVSGDEDADKVKERIESIKNTMDVLEADKLGVVFITPEMKKADMENAIANAKADRAATRVAEDEGIKSMDNQSQIVPYCPIYVKRKQVENPNEEEH